jgi:hypothetical protein
VKKNRKANADSGNSSVRLIKNVTFPNLRSRKLRKKLKTLKVEDSNKDFQLKRRERVG